MKFKSALVTQSSGSVGGATFAHNQGGLYVRARSIPTNPSSAFQVAVRNNMATLSNAWSNILTAAQRAAWAVYASNVSLVNALGDAIHVSGIAMYNRTNTPRLQAGVSRIDAAPTTFNLGSFTNPTITCVASSSNLSVAFTNTDSWAIAVGGYMLVYASRPQSPGINFFNGPYRFAGKISGAVVPPTSPVTIAVPFPVVAGQKVFYDVRVSQVDGRLSADFRGQLTCT